jgi:hypothetical protein
MAFVTDTQITSSIQGVFAKVAKFVGGVIVKATKSVGTFMLDMAEANSRSHMIQDLNNKTDRQLADMGIAREDIVRHVFRDKLHF